MKRLFFLLPLALLVGVIAVFAQGLTRDPKILPSMLIDRPLPEFSRPGVRAGDGGFSQADFVGRPKLLNVWASWCVTCRAEHPVLMQLKRAGVPIYGLAWKDTAERAGAVLDGRGDPYLANALDEAGRVGIDLGVTGTPETFVVDAEGRVRYKHVGPITPEVWETKLGPLLAQLEGRA